MHYSESAPYYRIDDYFATRKQKFQEIKDYTKTHPVNAILELGDFFDHPKISAECLSGIFTEWEKNIRYNPNSFGAIPVIGIEGNHELIGAQIKSYEKTSLHLLEACGFLQIASKDNPIIFTDKSGFTVAITGSPYDKDTDKNDDKDAYLVTQKAGDVHIHLAHGLIMNKSFGRKFAHTTIFELAPKTVADITINGHDHVGYPIAEVNGKWFANPGSIMRMKAENNEISRMPQFMVIEIHDDLSIHMEYIPFKCAEKGSLVLSTDHLELKKHKTNQLAQIQALVNAANVQTGLKISDIINDIGKTKGIEQEILEQAKQEIISAMDAMETPYNPSGEYYIQKVELENFLSHKNSTFDFTNGLNILAGESRSGRQLAIKGV